MKNLIITFVLVVLATCFVACKKSSDAKPEEEEKNEPAALDISKYIIKGTLTFPQNGKVYQHPYIIAFEDNGTATLYDFGAAGATSATYTFEQNLLILNFSGNAVWKFTIANGAITAASGPQSNILNYALYPVPSSNQLASNWYSGIMMNRFNNSAMYFAYKFTATQFQETVHDSPSTYSYTLIKNLMGISTRAGIKTYFLAMEGKLMVSRFDFEEAPSSSASFFFASLSKDE